MLLISLIWINKKPVLQVCAKWKVCQAIRSSNVASKCPFQVSDWDNKYLDFMETKVGILPPPPSSGKGEKSPPLPPLLEFCSSTVLSCCGRCKLLRLIGCDYVGLQYITMYYTTVFCCIQYSSWQVSWMCSFTEYIFTHSLLNVCVQSRHRIVKVIMWSL